MPASETIQNLLSKEWISIENALADAGILAHLEKSAPRNTPFIAYAASKRHYENKEVTHLPWLQQYVAKLHETKKLPRQVFILTPAPLSHEFPGKVYSQSIGSTMRMILCKHYSDLVALYNGKKTAPSLKAVDAIATDDDQQFLSQHGIQLSRVVLHLDNLDHLLVPANTAVCCHQNSTDVMELILEANTDKAISTFGSFDIHRILKRKIEEDVQKALSNQNSRQSSPSMLQNFAEKLFRTSYPLINESVDATSQQPLLHVKHNQALLAYYSEVTLQYERSTGNSLCGFLDEFFIFDTRSRMNLAAYTAHDWLGTSEIKISTTGHYHLNSEYKRFWQDRTKFIEDEMKAVMKSQAPRKEWFHLQGKSS